MYIHPITQNEYAQNYIGCFYFSTAQLTKWFNLRKQISCHNCSWPSWSTNQLILFFNKYLFLAFQLSSFLMIYCSTNQSMYFDELCRLQVLSLIISNFQSQQKTIIVICGTVRGFWVLTIIIFNELSKCWFRVFEIKCSCWP